MIMKAIDFNYPPQVAMGFVDDTVKRVKDDTNTSTQVKKIYEDIQTLVHLGFDTLKPMPQTAPGGTGDTSNS